MSDLQAFIKNRDLELTLINERGDVHYVGRATTVRPLNSKHYLRFITCDIFQNISPFTHAILHSGRRVFTTVIIKPIQPEYDVTTIDLVY